MPLDKFAQWWWWDGIMYKETNTIFKTKRIRLFALIIHCTIITKTNSRFYRNVYAISDRIWCNKHLRHTTTKKCDNNGKSGYFRVDDDHNAHFIVNGGTGGCVYDKLRCYHAATTKLPSWLIHHLQVHITCFRFTYLERTISPNR